VAPRVVLDSNIWVSAYITPKDNCARIVRAVTAGRFSGIISGYILGEVDRALSKKSLRKPYRIEHSDSRLYLSLIRSRLEIVIPSEVSFALRDPADSLVLGTALAGNATYLVTGDRDLLDDPNLLSWMRERGVLIVSPGEFNLD